MFVHLMPLLIHIQLYMVSSLNCHPHRLEMPQGEYKNRQKLWYPQL